MLEPTAAATPTRYRDKRAKGIYGNGDDRSRAIDRTIGPEALGLNGPSV